MHIITRRRLNEFAARHPQTYNALEYWYREMKRGDFASFAALLAIFSTADRVGKHTIFNVGGNRVRLVAAIHYNRRRIYVRAMLTHDEYDAGTWKE